MEQAVIKHSREIIGIGLSGGADSAMAAWMLKQAGAEVRGFTMQLHGSGTAEKAQRVAEKLDIPFAVLPLEDCFEETILSYFVESYAQGRTPSPCVLCNQKLKFGLMGQAILNAGCTHIATGHYARIERQSGQPVRLLRGVDASKDQSYFLAQLSPSQLETAYLPLGNSFKSEIFQAAKRMEFVAQDEGESQDLCFLPDGDFATFVGKRRPDLCREGWIIDSTGKKLGKHQGAFRYTRGQRRGLGLGGGPWFVKEISIPENLVTVSGAEELCGNTVHLEGMNWLQPPPEAGEIPCQGQIRFRMQSKSAVLTVLPGQRGLLTFREPVSAITPGQLAVCYQGQEVLASGWIS